HVVAGEAEVRCRSALLRKVASDGEGIAAKRDVGHAISCCSLMIGIAAERFPPENGDGSATVLRRAGRLGEALAQNACEPGCVIDQVPLALGLGGADEEPVADFRI